MVRLGIFLGIVVLAGCSASVGSRDPDHAVQYAAEPRSLAACTYEALDKEGKCDGLKISDYPTSGEARIACQVTAGYITTATSTIYSLEFIPAGAGSTVRFWSMRTVPGIRPWAERVLPKVEECAGRSPAARG